jgi:hypothetical protein
MPSDAQKKARDAADSARGKSTAGSAVNTVVTGIGLGLTATGVGAPVGVAVSIIGLVVCELSGSLQEDYESAISSLRDALNKASAEIDDY